MNNILELLSSLCSNCGDNRGRNGEYLSDQVQEIIEALTKQINLEP